MVTESCLSFFPSMPSRAAKKKTAMIRMPWKTKEMVRFTFDEFVFLRC